MPVAERTLTADECRAEAFEPCSGPPFWDILDDAHLGRVDHVVVLDLVGAFEPLEAQECQVRMERLVERGERIIVVNLKALAMIDSEGVGALVRSFVILKRAGGTMPIVNAPNHFRLLVASIGFA